MRYLCILFVFLYSTLNGQHLTRYHNIINLPKSSLIYDSISTLIQNARHYYSIHQESIGGQLINNALILAESSSDENALTYCLFENPGFLFESSFTLIEANSKKYYVDKALNYAEQKNNPFLLSNAYKELSAFYLSIGNYQEALYNAEISLSNAIRSDNDTAKVFSFIQLGLVNKYMAKNILAMHNFSNAQDIVFEKKIYTLEPVLYRNLAIFYNSLSKKIIARELLLKGIILNEENKIYTALTYDYMILSEMCNEEDVICRMNALSNAMKYALIMSDKGAEIEIRRRVLFNSIGTNKATDIIQAIKKDTVLRDFLDHICPGNLLWIYGQVYMNESGGKNNDSANYYFKKAEPHILKNAVLSIQKKFINEFGVINKIHNPILAISKFQKLLNIYDSADNNSGKAEVYHQLSELYHLRSDFKNAYTYGTLFEKYSKKNQEKSKDDEVALMMFQNDLNQKERVKLDLLMERNRKFRDQYLLLAALIAIFFFIMLFLGLFNVGTRILRAFGFFAFLLLFEYITLLSKKMVGKVTDGVPWMEFISFLILALLMLPIHSLLERRIIGYVEKSTFFRNKSSSKVFTALKNPNKVTIGIHQKVNESNNVNPSVNDGVDYG